MDIKNLEKIIPILQGIVEGKTLQRRTINNDWHNIPLSSIDYIAANPDDYRIKPNPKYRPFANVEECWQELLKHQPFGVTASKNDRRNYGAFKALCEDGCDFFDYEGETFESAFDEIMFADGTPFGVIVEE